MEKSQKTEMIRIFRPYVRKNGKLIRPKKGKCLCFLVKAER